MTELLLRERDVQADVVALYRSIGAHVYSTSVYRPGGAKIQAGIPDLICLMPRGGGVHFFECKRPKGKQSEEQVLFEARCTQAGVVYLCGGLEEARAALTLAGLVAE